MQLRRRLELGPTVREAGVIAFIIAIAFCVLALAELATFAQPAVTAPTLTEVQRLLVQNRILAVRLANAELEVVLKDLQVPDWDLDLNTLTYMPKKKAPAAP